MAKTPGHLKLSLAIAAALLVAGCAPRIDGSSDQRMQESMDQIRSELTEQERTQFDRGIAMIKQSIKDNGLTLFTGETTFDKKFRDAVDGATASEIIARGNRAQALEREKMQEMFPHVKMPE